MLRSLLPALLLACIGSKAQYTATWDPNNLPPSTENDQSGTNQCGSGINQTGLCQNIWVNSVQDFCIWGPPEPNSSISNVEEIVVSYCTQGGRGTRVIPAGTLNSAHFVETPDYIQVTGTGTLTNINIIAGDEGGELDPHGADGSGNPHGGLIFSTVWDSGTNGLGEQVHEWNNFMSDTEYCIRVCKAGDKATQYCNNVYDTYGCRWNMPGNYDDGFDQCMGDSDIPMGQYPQPDGSTSTYITHTDPTPAANNPASSSQCTTFTSSAIYTAAVAPPTGSSTSSPRMTAASNSRSPATPTSPTTSTTTHATNDATTFKFGSGSPAIVALFGLITGLITVV